MKSNEELNLPESLRYTDEHVWVRMDGGEAVIGISDFAQDPLKYALDKGFISGDNDKGTLMMKPQGATTRAQMASMLMRFLEKTKK